MSTQKTVCTDQFQLTDTIFHSLLANLWPLFLALHWALMICYLSALPFIDFSNWALKMIMKFNLCSCIVRGMKDRSHVFLSSKMQTYFSTTEDLQSSVQSMRVWLQFALHVFSQVRTCSVTGSSTVVSSSAIKPKTTLLHWCYFVAKVMFLVQYGHLCNCHSIYNATT